MLQPYSVVANFVAIQQVTLTDAAHALLGTRLIGTQEGIYLDVAGNRNGSYDLGDFLAATDRLAGPALASAAPK
jgi:hypothetical protein